MVRLEHILDSWKTIRQDTAGAVEEFPADDLDYRPTPDLATFRDIARHILDSSHGLTGMLLAGEPVFGGPDFRDRLRPHFLQLPKDLGSAELAAALRESAEQRTRELAAQSPEFYSEIVTRFGVPVTRLEMLQFVKEHELTHRQQLFMYLRLKGIVPATTRRRLAAQAGK
jgi:uncharacterized damage-inducible protein DinB